MLIMTASSKMDRYGIVVNVPERLQIAVLSLTEPHAAEFIDAIGEPVVMYAIKPPQSTAAAYYKDAPHAVAMPILPDGQGRIDLYSMHTLNTWSLCHLFKVTGMVTYKNGMFNNPSLMTGYMTLTDYIGPQNVTAVADLASPDFPFARYDRVCGAIITSKISVISEYEALRRVRSNAVYQPATA